MAFPPPFLILEHDGSLEGRLTAICEFLNTVGGGMPPENIVIRGRGGPAGLFEDRRPVDPDQARVARLLSRLALALGRDAAGKEAVDTVLLALRSDLEGVDLAAARLIARSLKRGGAALDELGDEAARLVEKAAVRTRREAHRMLGLLRFRELSDASLFATIEPDCDLLALIADHFAERFPGLRWAIRDEGRETALVHVPGRPWMIGPWLGILPVEGDGGVDGSGRPPELPLSDAETRVVEFWRRYFESVAITGRLNPRLQSSFMPKKYWKNLTEIPRSAD
jgi:probable DNA metabolism protein